MRIPSREEGDFVEGVYNFCDRWCERCPMSSRCEQYAVECARDALDADESDDGDDIDFMETTLFEGPEGSLLSDDMGDDDMGDDDMGDEDMGDEEEIEFLSHPFDDVDDFEMDAYLLERERIDRETNKTTCVRMADRYLGDGHRWIDEWDILLEELDDAGGILRDAREVILWDLFQISVKLRRAINGKLEENDPSSAEDTLGSAKVVLIGMDRSKKAWAHIRSVLSKEQQKSVDPLLNLLEELIAEVEREIPMARAFKRPGFDT